MICDICGHEIADDATFCFYCGNPINGLGVPDEPQDVTAKQDHGPASCLRRVRCPLGVCFLRVVTEGMGIVANDAERPSV